MKIKEISTITLGGLAAMYSNITTRLWETDCIRKKIIYRFYIRKVQA